MKKKKSVHGGERGKKPFILLNQKRGERGIEARAPQNNKRSPTGARKRVGFC